MIDRTIPFYNTILRCDDYQPYNMTPEGYSIASYRRGNERDWARLECAVGDFEKESDAIDYFQREYLAAGNHEDILFLRENSGLVVGTCTAWSAQRNGERVNSLDWLVVDEAFQGKGLGRALCMAVIDRFYAKNKRPIYIHTQPWSWKAIMLYISLGFRLQRSDTFNGYTNEYQNAVKTLRELLTEEQYELLLKCVDQ